MVSALASGARGPRFDPCSRRGKFLSLNTLSLVSFAGMTLDKCIVLGIGTLTFSIYCQTLFRVLSAGVLSTLQVAG